MRSIFSAPESAEVQATNRDMDLRRQYGDFPKVKKLTYSLLKVKGFFPVNVFILALKSREVMEVEVVPNAEQHMTNAQIPGRTIESKQLRILSWHGSPWTATQTDLHAKPPETENAAHCPLFGRWAALQQDTNTRLFAKICVAQEALQFQAFYLLSPLQAFWWNYTQVSDKTGLKMVKAICLIWWSISQRSKTEQDCVDCVLSFNPKP